MELGCHDPQMVDDDDSDTKVGGQMSQQPQVGVEASG